MLHGEEEMTALIKPHYADLLEVGQQVLEFVKTELFKNLPEAIPDDKRFTYGVCLPLMSMGFKIVRGINYLAARAMDELAFISLRPLGEAFATLGWIMSETDQREERARLYMWAEIIETYKLTIKNINPDYS
jgi:hypothetical protein